MPVDFFSNPHVQTLDDKKFGLCDMQPPPSLPAYTDLTNIDEWIGVVSNPAGESIDFFPIDGVIVLYKPNGDMDKSCDVMLRINTQSDDLYFIELKDRKNNSWSQKALEQLISTISHFNSNHPMLVDKIKICYICNKQKPNFSNSNKTRLLKFYDESKDIVGRSIELKIQTLIEV